MQVSSIVKSLSNSTFFLWLTSLPTYTIASYVQNVAKKFATRDHTNLFSMHYVCIYLYCKTRENVGRDKVWSEIEGKVCSPTMGCICYSTYCTSNSICMHGAHPGKGREDHVDVPVRASLCVQITIIIQNTSQRTPYSIYIYMLNLKTTRNPQCFKWNYTLWGDVQWRNMVSTLHMVYIVYS